METPSSLLTSPCDQSQKRKGRNSAIRKEQNRVASRAYREKRKQKLALLDEILRSDTHADSMSSVSEERECSPTTPPLESRVLEYTNGIRHSSMSPVPSYACGVPGLALASANNHHLLSGNTESCVDYHINGYIQETERFSPNTEFPHDATFSPIGMTPSPIPTLCSVSSVTSMPMFPFDEVSIGSSFSDYSLPDGGATDVPMAPEYDLNMTKALEVLSVLSDNQLQQVVAYIQKRKPSVPQDAARPDMDFSHLNCTYHTPRLNQVPGMKEPDWRYLVL